MARLYTLNMYAHAQIVDTRDTVCLGMRLMRSPCLSEPTPILVRHLQQGSVPQHSEAGGGGGEGGGGR